MYNIVRCHVKEDLNWKLKDVSNETLEFILANYQSVRVTVTFDSNPLEKEIKLTELKGILSVTDKEQTLSEWLGTYDSDILPTHKEPTQLSQARNIKFKDLSDYPLKVSRGSHVFAEGAVLPIGSDTDIKLCNDLPDHDSNSTFNLGANSIVCCNGRLLETVYSHGCVYGVNGSLVAEKEGTGILSLIDFTDVGGCLRIKMTDQNIKLVNHTDAEKASYRLSAVVDVGTSLVGKTPMVSLDGRLHFDRATIKPISDTKVKVTVSVHAAAKLALERPEEPLSWIAPANVSKDGLRLDSFNLLEYLKVSGSFIILVHNDDLSVKREPLSQTAIAGYYRHYRIPNGLVMDENGCLLPHMLDGYSERIVSLGVGDRTERLTYLTESTPLEGMVMSRATLAGKREIKEAEVVDIYTV